MGRPEFNEVFLTDVRVPQEAILGEEGHGWAVATATLMSERVALGGVGGGKGGGPIRRLINQWERRRDELGVGQRLVMRDRVTDLWVRAEVLRLTNQRTKDLARAGAPGPQGSLGKLMSAELNQAISMASVDLLGPEGMLHEDGYPMERVARAIGRSSLSAQFPRARANTIEGGTSEILRNILGERVLGLPGEPRI
jgi:alkylation response protein AidB-like acyl-CoA dehydrogenase